MKKIQFLFAVLFCSIAFGDTSLNELYRDLPERPGYSSIRWSSDEQAYVEYNYLVEEDIALISYSEEIAKMDDETICKNPELVFRRASLWFDNQEKTEDIDVILRDLHRIASDFRFVAEHAEKGSRLERAAQIKVDFLRTILDIEIEDEETLYFRTKETVTMILQRWADDPNAIDRELRQQVMRNVETSSEVAQAFTDYLILFFGEPDLVLGYIQPTDTKIEVIVGPNRYETSLRFQVKYEKDSSSVCISFDL